MVRDIIILLWGFGEACLVLLNSLSAEDYIAPSSVTGGLIEVEFTLALNSAKKDQIFMKIRRRSDESSVPDAQLK